MPAAVFHSSSPAPELSESLEWLNLQGPLRMADLRGQVCALAFVNAGSAWSLQCMRDLDRLQVRHDGRLQVIAIHVPRFDHERDARRVAQWLARQEIGFPIALDAHWAAWQQYEIEAWPTVVLIDAEGEVRERVVGADSGSAVDTCIVELLEESPPAQHDSAPIELRHQAVPSLSLRFPSGLAVSAQYLYVLDSGNHRIVECDHAGRVLRQFGTGDAGFLDGSPDSAAFNRPRGICLQRDALYVADSGNHALRRIDLRSGDVATLIGSGRRGPTLEGPALESGAIALDDPMALAMAGELLLVACRGDNRIWQYDLSAKTVQLAAGSGELAIRDGAGAEAAFAEPVSLAAVQQLVYVCDGAGSAIRSVNIRNRQVSTLVGLDPWTHGNTDGVRSDALLQHPQAIALDPDAPLLWIADSGNNLLRTLRLGGGELSTFALSQPLHGPAGLAVADGVVWIADTQAHAILRLDVRSGALRRVPVGE